MMKTLFVPVAAVALVTIAGHGSEADAAAYGCKESAKYCLVADACKVSEPICGSIVYINKGGYDVTSERLNARSEQPDTPTIHPACAGVNLDSTASMALGQYIQWIIPASCAYHLKINIVAGPKKDRNLFLTPGCVIETSTDKTTMNSEWHMKVYWAPALKKSGKPADPAGNECGKLGKM